MPDEPSPSELPDLPQMSEIAEIPEEHSFTDDPAAAGWSASSREALSDEHRAVEAVVLSAVEPVPPTLLAELLEMPVERVETVCDELAAEYERQRRGFVLTRIAGGYRYQTHPDMAPFVERYAMEGVSARLSSAALETLAIIAYRQPISRAQISALRGVNVDGVVRLLEQRGYIEAVGVAPGPGQPTLYGTTTVFLEKLGLNDLSQLPRIEELLPGPEVMQQLEEQVRPSTGA
jgi:segregation and condensation protein B